MDKTSDEKWRPVNDYEGLYEISNHGRFKSLHKRNKGRILATSLRTGYPSVKLSKNGREQQKRIHRLLAEAWIDNPEQKPWVDHIDGNKLNHSLSNLRWVTKIENRRYAQSLKLWKPIIKQIKECSNLSESLRCLTEAYQISDNESSKNHLRRQRRYNQMRPAVKSQGGHKARVRKK